LLNLGEVLLCVGANLVRGAAAYVLLDLPVVLAPVKHDGLNKTEVLSMGPSADFLPLFVGYCHACVAFAAVSLGEAHNDLRLIVTSVISRLLHHFHAALLVFW